MNSCLYLGRVRHRRFTPHEHFFSYRLFMVYLDLAELDHVFRARWFWSTRRWAPARFCRSDYFGDPERALDVCVRDKIEQEIGQRPQGPIRLLTHLRYFGYCFNPISIYYCFDANDQQLENLLVEVSNTPWGERRCYVLPMVDGRRHRFAKTMHVSPFMPMNLQYDWYCNEPGAHLSVHMNVLRDGVKFFDATMGLRRKPLSGLQLAATLIANPVMTYKVIAAIYWEAVRLWWKKTPIFDHAPVADTDTKKQLKRSEI